MCGRYSLFSILKELQDVFSIEEEFDNYLPSYNIAPGSSLPIIRNGDQKKEIAFCHWGLKPYWVKPDQKIQPINARAETIAEKPSFREPFKRRRCLIPANGFYEWKRNGKHKQPYYFNIHDNSLFAFAGIWDRWRNQDQTIESFAIITTQANKVMQPVHDRMPVILHPEDNEEWLNNANSKLLVPYAGELSCYPVSERANSPQNNDQALITPLG